MYRSVRVWLIVGLVMILFQILLGGITRLTGSGLSITKWEIVTGTIPPMNHDQWIREFDLYKDTPQFQKINREMSLGEFKVIYFWEYLHRLWARLMGLVFVIPFAIFLLRKMIDKRLLRQLVVVILLAGLVASFGWIMVASGLINRPWVDAYKLTIHLSLACVLFVYLFWITLNQFRIPDFALEDSKTLIRTFMFLIIIQIVLGGVVAGTHAAMMYPTWPDMNGKFIPEVLLQENNWSKMNFLQYEYSPFLGSLVQFTHRIIAYIIGIIGIWLSVQMIRKSQTNAKKLGFLILTVVTLQIILGIVTVMNSKGYIPVAYGVLHQAFGIISLALSFFMIYSLSNGKKAQIFLP